MNPPEVRSVPEGYATLTTLRAQGLRPAEPRLTWRWYRRGWQHTPLYLIREAQPPTPEQRQAERDARNAGARARRQARKDLEQALILRRQQDRDQALGCFRRWASEPGYVVLDTETTGLHGHVIEVAVVTVAGEVLLDTLIRSTEPVEPDARAVHGITDEALSRAPSFPWVVPHLKEALRDQTVLIYNAEFDYARLKATRLAHGLERGVLSRSRTGCVMDAYATLHGEYDPEDQDYRWTDLGTACQQMGVSLSPSHRALADAQATAALVRAVAARDWSPVTKADIPWGFWAEAEEGRRG